MDRIQVVSKGTDVEGTKSTPLTSHQINSQAPKIQEEKYFLIDCTFSSVIQ